MNKIDIFIMERTNLSIYQHFSETEIEILRERSERIARDNIEQETQATIAALIVMMHGEVYALPVEHILTIYEDVPIIPVPSVPTHIRGIANLRGHITPVIDLGILLDVPDIDTDFEKYYLIVVSDTDHTAAFFVEQVGDIVEFASENISPLTAESDEKSPFLQGIAPSGETLLNILAIFNHNKSQV